MTGEYIQCPFHGFEDDLSGACTLVPANGWTTEPPKALHVETCPIREAHGFIYLWRSEPRPDTPPLPWFESIPEMKAAYKKDGGHPVAA